MELTSTISFGLGLLDAINKISDIKDNLKTKYLGYDKCFHLLDKISIEVIEKNIGRKTTLGQSIRIINSLRYELLEGDEASLRLNLIKLLNIDEQRLSAIISDFEDKIINSNSLEMITLINLSQNKRLEKIDTNVQLIVDQFKRLGEIDSETGEIFDNLQELMLSSVKNGNLKDTLQKIDLLTLDSFSKFPHFKDFLVLLQSRIILKVEDSGRYKIQLKRLERISNSFKKFYYMLQLTTKLFPKTSIDVFLKETESYQFEKELSIAFLLLNDKNYTQNFDELDRCDEEAKEIVLKQYLLNLINTNATSIAKELIEKYDSYLNDHESKLYILANNFNIFHKSIKYDELTKNDKEFLSSHLNRYLDLEKYFLDYSPSFFKSYYHNICVTKILLRDSIWENFIEFFLDDEWLLENAISFARKYRYSNEILNYIEKSSVKNKQQIFDHYISIKMELGHYQDVSKYEINDPLISTDQIRLNVALAKNFIKFNELKENFSEKDIFKLEVERSNLIIYVYISRFFYSISKEDISKKYYDKTMEFSDPSPDEVLHIAALSELLGNRDHSKELYRSIFEKNPNAKLLFAKILESETNNFELPSYEVTHFFNAFDISDEQPVELQRIKAKYLFQQRELDKASKLLIWLVDNFNNDTDWFNLILMYIESGKIDEALQYLPRLKELHESATILLLIGLLSLYITSKPDIREFSMYFFKGEKKNIENGLKFDGKFLFPIWGKIIQRQIALIPINNYIHKDSYVRLKKIDGNEILHLCIHSTSEFIIPFDQEYLNCKHLHYNDPIIKDLLLKEDVKFKISQNTLSLIEKEISDSQFIANLKSILECEVCSFESFQKLLRNKLTNDELIRYDSIIYKYVERSTDTVSIRDIEYSIEYIDSVWNYPLIYLSNLFRQHPEEYGLQIVDLKPDIPSSLITLMSSSRDEIYTIKLDYKKLRIPLYIFSRKEYGKYLSAILEIFNDENLNYSAGLGKKYGKNQQFIISISSLFILYLFQKIDHIPIRKFLIPKSLLDELDKISFEVTDSIGKENLQIFLDDDYTLRKIQVDKAESLLRAKTRENFKNKVSNLTCIDTTDIKDDFTPIISIIGKIAVDCIRISINNKLPIILDEEFTQRSIQLRNVTNIIPFYFENSGEPLLEKLLFLKSLSRMKYRYIIYHDFIPDCFSIFLDQNFTLIGENTVLGTFLDLIRQEIYVRYYFLDLFQEIIKGIKVLLLNYLNPSTEVILKNFLTVFPNEDLNNLKNTLLQEFYFNEPVRNYILHCFKRNDE